MSSESQTIKRTSFVTVTALLGLCWIAYAPALSGSFLYDDWHNLAGLASVDDTFSASQFVFSGHAGPLGRPLSLATFVPQAEYWDDDARPFILVNILVHLANAALVFVLLLSIGRNAGNREKEAYAAAIAGTALWAFMPLLASASLLVVQRMATLATLFCLLGLVVYLHFRRTIDTRPRRSLVGMSVTLFACTGLAVLCKENGAVLPSLALVLESTVLNPPRSMASRQWRGWKLAVLGVPTVLVGAVLATQLPYSTMTELQRGFSGAERLLTQTVILWEYLARAFFAQPWKLGPFHDDHEVFRSLASPEALCAALAWCAALSAAVYFRRRYRIASFAVLWFLAAHLIESTTVPINLYFEHRNYLPILGPVFALSYYAVGIAHKYRTVARIGFGAYVAANVVLLMVVTSMWGRPDIATAYWHVNAPSSAAAVSELARRQMHDIGARVGMLTLNEFAIARPEFTYLRLPELTLSCRLDPEGDKTVFIEYLDGRLPHMSYSPGVGPIFDELLNQVSETPCRGVDLSTVVDLARTTFANPRYQSPEDRSFYHQLLAKVAMQRGDLDEVVRELTLANSANRHRDVDLMLVTTLVNAGRFDEAQEVIDVARRNPSRSPTARIADELMLRDLSRYASFARTFGQDDSPAPD